MTFEEQGTEDEGICEIIYVVFPIVTRLGSGIRIGLLALCNVPDPLTDEEDATNTKHMGK